MTTNLKHKDIADEIDHVCKKMTDLSKEIKEGSLQSQMPANNYAEVFSKRLKSELNWYSSRLMILSDLVDEEAE